MEEANTVVVSIEMDADLLKDFESVLAKLGLDMSTAFTIFCKAVISHGGFPFEITDDLL